jgi:fructose-bisphosphate aldolase/6-deoxy-5-ketofructose 1-phosphate synthase
MNHLIPADVPQEMRATYIQNLDTITKGTGRLFIFAGDQKVEHMNNDFYGESISLDDASPEHLFKIAGRAKIGAFASQLGLIAQYGSDFPTVPYIIKMNSKTDLVKTTQKDPYSAAWISVDAVARFRKSSGLQIAGIGYTMYPGSEYEPQMFSEAAKLVFEAHQQGLVAVLWSYARGKAVTNEKDPHLVAGTAGIAACMGADYVKVSPPKSDTVSPSEALKEAVLAAGRTKVICAGGGSMGVKPFLQTLHDQIHIAGCSGNATGRNIHQKSLDDAVRFCAAIHAVTIENKTVDEAMEIYATQ